MLYALLLISLSEIKPTNPCARARAQRVINQVEGVGVRLLGLDEFYRFNLCSFI